MNLPDQILPGNSLLIRKEQLYGRKYAIGGKDFTEVKDYYYFSPGLSQDSDTWFSADLKLEFFLLNSPRYFVLLMPVEVLHRKDIEAANLRIPKQVWNRVSGNSDDKKQLERLKVNQAYLEDYGPLNTQCLRLPLNSKIVSDFASPRRLPDGRQYYHSGLDLRAGTGTPIPAAGEGQVLIAEHMIVPGNNVMISHGAGFFSRYMHLSKINVSPREQVKKGQAIGLAGATGRVEAAHLHWELSWKGNRVDPLQFLQVWERICDPG